MWLVPRVATASPEALVEHDGGFVALGHALKHSVRSHGCRVPEPHHPSRQQPQPPRRGAAAPFRNPTTCRTRRRAAFPAPRGPALVCRRLDTRSSQLHAAACLDRCKELKLAHYTLKLALFLNA